MKLTINIITSNDAYVGDDAAYNVAQRLRQIADRISRGVEEGNILDSVNNSAVIGSWRYEPEAVNEDGDQVTDLAKQAWAMNECRIDGHNFEGDAWYVAGTATCIRCGVVRTTELQKGKPVATYAYPELNRVSDQADDSLIRSDRRRIAYHADESFVHPRDHDKFIVVEITEGEPGYRMVPGSYPTVESAKEAAAGYNAESNLSDEDVLTIRISSMAAHFSDDRTH